MRTVTWLIVRVAQSQRESKLILLSFQPVGCVVVLITDLPTYSW